MWLLTRHPVISNLSCSYCQTYEHDDEGRVELGRDGNPALRLLNCGAEFLAPCRDPKRKCPKGTPENPRTLSLENQLCYEHYRECKAVRQFPNDPVVRRNAAIIQEAIDREKDRKQAEFRRRMMKAIQQ